MNTYVAPESWTSPEFSIRSYHAGDGPLLREATNSSFDHLKATMPWALRDQTEEEALSLVRRFRARYLMAEDFVMGIFSPAGDELLGGTGFHLREGGLESGNAEVGMWIRAERAGQGLGTRALRAMLAWGFDEWPWQRIAWKASADNVPSQRVAEKAGMQPEGVLRSHLIVPDGSRRDTALYAALRSEWQAES